MMSMKVLFVMFVLYTLQGRNSTPGIVKLILLMILILILILIFSGVNNGRQYPGYQACKSFLFQS